MSSEYIKGLKMKAGRSLNAVKILIVLSAAMVIFAGGCVERKLTINTEPQEALVYLNDEEIESFVRCVIGDAWCDFRNQASRLGLYSLLQIPFYLRLIIPGYFLYLTEGIIME